MTNQAVSEERSEERISEEVKDRSTAKGWWRPVALIAAVLILLTLAHTFGIGEQVGALRGWIESLGLLGPLVFVGIYAGAVVAAIPGSALTVLAGALFGSVLGVVVVSAASTLGAALCFLIARYFARDATAGWIGRSERFRRLDEMTEQHGAIMVALTRLLPIFPFNLLNYGFGLTRVRFWTYVFWSWLCMLPGTVVFVVGADAFTRGLAEGRVPWELLPVLGGVAVLLFFLVRMARRRLQSSEAVKSGDETARQS